MKAKNLEILVCKKRCNQCLFSKNKIVSNERKKEILQQCKDKEEHFICHKGSLKGKNVMCKGFFDSKYQTPMQQVAQRLNMLTYIDPKNI